MDIDEIINDVRNLCIENGEANKILLFGDTVKMIDFQPESHRHKMEIRKRARRLASSINASMAILISEAWAVTPEQYTGGSLSDNENREEIILIVIELPSGDHTTTFDIVRGDSDKIIDMIERERGFNSIENNMKILKREVVN